MEWIGRTYIGDQQRLVTITCTTDTNANEEADNTVGRQVRPLFWAMQYVETSIEFDWTIASSCLFSSSPQVVTFCTVIYS